MLRGMQLQQRMVLAGFDIGKRDKTDGKSREGSCRDQRYGSSQLSQTGVCALILLSAASICI